MLTGAIVDAVACSSTTTTTHCRVLQFLGGPVATTSRISHRKLTRHQSPVGVMSIGEGQLTGLSALAVVDPIKSVLQTATIVGSGHDVAL